jgi:hypothetical protein
MECPSVQRGEPGWVSCFGLDPYVLIGHGDISIKHARPAPRYPRRPRLLPVIHPRAAPGARGVASALWVFWGTHRCSRRLGAVRSHPHQATKILGQVRPRPRVGGSQKCQEPGVVRVPVHLNTGEAKLASDPTKPSAEALAKARKPSCSAAKRPPWCAPPAQLRIVSAGKSCA